MIIVNIPETTSYFWKQSRSATYISWPFNDSDKCNAERMAAAGFYVVEGNGSDLVECFMCGKQFSGWQPEDDPWSKHMRYQLICPFVGLNRQDENKWTMKELYRLCEEYDIKIDRDNVKRSLDKLKDDRERLVRNQFLYRMLDKYRNDRRKIPEQIHYQDLLDQVINILMDNVNY